LPTQEKRKEENKKKLSRPNKRKNQQPQPVTRQIPLTYPKPLYGRLIFCEFRKKGHYPQVLGQKEGVAREPLFAEPSLALLCLLLFFLAFDIEKEGCELFQPSRYCLPGCSAPQWKRIRLECVWESLFCVLRFFSFFLFFFFLVFFSPFTTESAWSEVCLQHLRGASSEEQKWMGKIIYSVCGMEGLFLFFSPFFPFLSLSLGSCVV
jgi:hypothetical protein